MRFPQYHFLKSGEEILIFHALRGFLRIVLTENFARAKNGPQGARQLVKLNFLTDLRVQSDGKSKIKIARDVFALLIYELYEIRINHNLVQKFD